MQSQLARDIETALREAMKEADAGMDQVYLSKYALSTQEGYGYTPRLDVSEVAKIAARVAVGARPGRLSGA